jgi:hypothetical protein
MSSLNLIFDVFLAMTAVLSAVLLPLKIDDTLKKRHDTKKTRLIILALIWIGFMQTFGEQWMRWLFAADLLVIAGLILWRHFIPHVEVLSPEDIRTLTDKLYKDRRVVSHVEFIAAPRNTHGLIIIINRYAAPWIKRAIHITGDNCPHCLVELEVTRRASTADAAEIIAAYRTHIADGLACHMIIPTNSMNISMQIVRNAPAAYVPYCQWHMAPAAQQLDGALAAENVD